MPRLALVLLGTFLTALWADATLPEEHAITKRTKNYVYRNEYRLPDDVRPRHYSIQLQPDFYGDRPSAFSFEGQTTILVDCVQDTNDIVLHMDRLNIFDSDISVKKENSQEELFVASSYEPRYHFLHLRLMKTLKAGNTYVLKFRRFSGPLSADSKGLYLSQYRDGQETVYLVASRTAPVYARKVFPCFDEPQLKATFDVHLVRRRGTRRHYISLSNTALNASTDRDIKGQWWTVDSFERTPKMSTYRLAFVVGDFTYLEDTSASDSTVTYRTYARPNALQWAHRAHGYGLKVFDWFSRHFRPRYGQALSKLDNIALPVYNSEANWGLLTSREVILYQPGVTSAYYELWMASLISHSIAHMWFGNYVSVQWWRWLWLDEALANWWGVYVTEQVNPGWSMVEDWISLYMYPVLETDARVTSRPLTADVDTPEQISDVINDRKGPAIVRMMQFLMGFDSFVDGLNLYLQNNLYGNVETSDLFSALDQKMQEQRFGEGYISAKMGPWVSQMGFPVVMVQRTAGGYRLTQKRFLISSEEGVDETNGDSPHGYQWEIPIVYATSEDANMHKSREDIRWLSKNSALDIAVSETNSWILINVHQVAYCRVLYDTDTWYALIGQLKRDPSVIPSINRGQIINDAWNLAKAGMLSMSVALSTLDFLQSDTGLAPWRAFDREVDYMALMLGRTVIFPAFQTKIQSLLWKPVKKLTLTIGENTAPTEATLQTLIAEHACTYGVKECVDDARRLFTAWKTTGENEINANLRFYYYCTAVAEGDATDWDFVRSKFTSTDDTQERKRLRRALSCSRDGSKLQRLLEMSLDPTQIPAQDQTSTIMYVSQNPAGRDLAYHFFLDHVDRLSSKVLSHVTSHFNTNDDLKKLQDLAKAHVGSAVGSAVDEAIGQTRINMAWLQANYGFLSDWLTAQ